MLGRPNLAFISNFLQRDVQSKEGVVGVEESTTALQASGFLDVVVRSNGAPYPRDDELSHSYIQLQKPYKTHSNQRRTPDHEQCPMMGQHAEVLSAQCGTQAAAAVPDAELSKSPADTACDDASSKAPCANQATAAAAVPDAELSKSPVDTACDDASSKAPCANQATAAAAVPDAELSKSPADTACDDASSKAPCANQATAATAVPDAELSKSPADTACDDASSGSGYRAPTVVSDSCPTLRTRGVSFRGSTLSPSVSDAQQTQFAHVKSPLLEQRADVCPADVCPAVGVGASVAVPDMTLSELPADTLCDDVTSSRAGAARSRANARQRRVKLSARSPVAAVQSFETMVMSMANEAAGKSSELHTCKLDNCASSPVVETTVSKPECQNNVQATSSYVSTGTPGTQQENLVRKEMMRLGIAIVIIKRARLIGIPTTEYLNSLRHNCIKSRSLDDCSSIPELMSTQDLATKITNLRGDISGLHPWIAGTSASLASLSPQLKVEKTSTVSYPNKSTTARWSCEKILFRRLLPLAQMSTQLPGDICADRAFCSLLQYGLNTSSKVDPQCRWNEVRSVLEFLVGGTSTSKGVLQCENIRKHLARATESKIANLLKHDNDVLEFELVRTISHIVKMATIRPLAETVLCTLSSTIYLTAQRLSNVAQTDTAPRLDTWLHLERMFYVVAALEQILQDTTIPMDTQHPDWQQHIQRASSKCFEIAHAFPLFAAAVWHLEEFCR